MFRKIFSFAAALILLLSVCPFTQAQGGTPYATITFVRRDKTETTVSFNSASDKLGLNGTPGQSGRWFFKSYFIGWSENPNYKDNGKGHLFFESATAGDCVAALGNRPIKLYALYASSGSLSAGKSLNAVSINDNVSANEFVRPGNPTKSGKLTTAAYQPNQDYEIRKLDATFKIHPFVAAAVYKNAWVGALENGSTWSHLSRKKGNVTVVDLHVHVDERLVLPDEFDLTFHSYTFRPYSVFSAVKADGTPVQDDEFYPYIGVDQPGDKERYGVLSRIQKDNPDTTFRTKSYVLDANGKKVPIHDFVIRTRIRVGYDKYGNRIPASMEQIQSDMHLIMNSAAFKVPADVAQAIAQKKQDPISINGFVDMQVKGIYGGPIKAAPERLTFSTDQPLRVPLKAKKTLLSGRMKAGEFTFVLKDRHGKVLEKVTNAADGTVRFSDRTFSNEVSNWLYTVSEEAGNNKGIAYDKTVYTVKVTTKASDGGLKASVALEKNGVPFDGDMVFVNRKAMPSTGDQTPRMILLTFMAAALLGGVYMISLRKKRAS